MRDFRGCRASATRKARTARARAQRRHPRRQRRLRARALRRIANALASDRRQCSTRFARRPGPVTSLSARATSRSTVVLSFEAAGTDGSKPPAAKGYVVKQSRRPIRTSRDFARAHTLCGATCRFGVTQVGAAISLRVVDLRPGTTYHFAVAARDNVSGKPGARSKPVRVKTRGTAPRAR